MPVRILHRALGASLVGVLAALLGCATGASHEIVAAENHTLEAANDKLAAAVEQYEIDAAAFEQHIFRLEQRLSAVRAREDRLRAEASDLLERVHTLEAASISLYVDRVTLDGLAVPGKLPYDGLLTALAEEIEAGRVHVRLVPRTADGRLDMPRLAAQIPDQPLALPDTAPPGASLAAGEPDDLPSVSSQPPAEAAPAAGPR